MRLIDADDLKTLKFQDPISNHGYDTAYRVGFNDAIDDVIECAPTIDAVEVVHGEWKPFDRTFGREIWYCTSCETSMHMQTEMGKPMYKYCPMCGARMKGENDE